MWRIAQCNCVQSRRAPFAFGWRARHTRDMPNGKTTAEFIDAIIKELGGDAIEDPRKLANRTASLDRYVRAEVRREINRLRSPQTVLFDLPTAADIRKARETLDRLLPPAVVAGLQAIWQEQPERSNELKYRCASGAWYLMESFSRSERTSAEDGPFRVITQLLYSATTGEHDVNIIMRVCDWILQKRREGRADLF
jgi:hypothetical protein